ncbi:MULTISPECIES: hypothetical protein [Paraburkholderia]|jgi:hypothetical protein|uniref:hypothetical protein n=1 Tax=Paraburkholderia TaxID=1822464 RepID=UPI0038BD21D1
MMGLLLENEADCLIRQALRIWCSASTRCSDTQQAAEKKNYTVGAKGRWPARNRKCFLPYEYDHRSLAEDLDQIQIPQDIEVMLGEKASTVARLIKGEGRRPDR